MEKICYNIHINTPKSVKYCKEEEKTMKAFYQHDFKKEICKHGTSLSYNLHFHHHVELVYMFSGKGVAIVEGKEHVLESGDVLVVFPNQLHEYRVGENENFFISIFRPELLNEYKEIFYTMLPENCVYHSKNKSELLLEIATKLPQYSSSDKCHKNNVYRGLLLAFFGELFSNINLVKTKQADLSVLKSILVFCNENYRKEINLDAIANNLHVSKYYISHLLNDKLGIAFNEYINSLRISDAVIMLDERKYGISEIAEKCGFNTVRTFNRAFKSIYGISPSEYKKK